MQGGLNSIDLSIKFAAVSRFLLLGRPHLKIKNPNSRASVKNIIFQSVVSETSVVTFVVTANVTANVTPSHIWHSNDISSSRDRFKAAAAGGAKGFNGTSICIWKIVCELLQLVHRCQMLKILPTRWIDWKFYQTKFHFFGIWWNNFWCHWTKKHSTRRWQLFG